jgi:hypothetical protein
MLRNLVCGRESNLGSDTKRPTGMDNKYSPEHFGV